MSLAPNIKELFENLDDRQREAANKVVALEKRHGFKSRNKYLDEDIVEEIVKTIKQLVRDEREVKS